MASGDLDFGEFYAKIFRLRKRLDDLGEKDKDDAVHTGTDVASMKLEVSRLEKKLKKIERPQSEERKVDIELRFAGNDNVSFLTRRALVRCVIRPQAKKFFADMLKQAGEFGDPSGRVFTVEDVNGATSKVTCEFSRRELDEASDDDTGGISQGKASVERAEAPKAKVKGKAQAKKKPQAKLPGDEDEDDPDLDAEQDIDLDVKLDEKEMRGLVDLFESVLEPVNDEGRRAWLSNMPAGSWVEDDNALMGRLNKRGISLAMDLMGRIPGPGQQSFNNYATARLKHKGISMDMHCEANPECPPLQPHQQAVEFLLHAASPIERLLVDHPTGCGKTREMIAVLNSYFHDPRPKIPIFPTESVCRNFYLELLRWPNRYRDFFCCEEPELALRAAGLAPGGKVKAEAERLDAAQEAEVAEAEPEAEVLGNEVKANPAAGESAAEKDSASGIAEQGNREIRNSANDDWKPLRDAMWTLAGIPEAELKAISTSFRECLEMSGTFVSGKLRKCRRFEFKQKNPGEEFPSAPLRALGYTSAGGSNIKLDRATGMPLSSLFKVGFGKPYSNVYDRKIILMDEVHNLVRSNTRYTEQLETLRKKLSTAENLVLVGFTATPIPNEKSEGRLLLDTIKGELHLGLSDEGFISSFPFKPPHLFPRSSPEGVPDVALTPEVQQELCRTTELCGDSLLAYDLHAREPDVRGKQLRVYCNMFCHGSNFHDGKLGCKAELLARPQELAPKLHAVVREVVTPRSGERTKALVLVRRSSGYNALVALMRQAGKAAVPPFNVATMANLSEFNSPKNATGKDFLVMVAETAECGEGISFKAVRRQYITDVPETPADFIQQCGRANRMYGHQVLDPEERTLHTQVFVAVLPQWLQDNGLSVWCYRVFSRRGTPSAEAELLGRQFCQQLQQCSIDSLDTLKVMLDFFASRKFNEHESAAGSKRSMKSKEFKLGTQDIAEFLEALGLTEAAQALRALRHKSADENGAAENSDDEGKVLMDRQQAANTEDKGAINCVETPAEATDTDVVMAEKAVLTGDESGAAKMEGLAESIQEGKAACTKDCMVEDTQQEGHGTEHQAALLNDKVTAQEEVGDSDAQKSAGEQGALTMDVCKSVRLMLRAVLKLHSNSREEVARMARDAAQTEDQRALQNLKELYDDFLPALSTIRNSAVDRMVLSRPEDRAMLEAAAAVKPEHHPAFKLPPIDREMTARLETLFPEKTEDPSVPTKPSRRGRQPKASALDATKNSSNDEMPDAAISCTDASQVRKAATPARGVRRRKGADQITDADEASHKQSAATDSGPARPLRRARSKVNESAVTQPISKSESVASEVALEVAEVAKKTDPSVKICGRCTYHNGPKRKRCEMCQNSLEAVKAEDGMPAKKRVRTA
mmetsp:Transcript_62984/g.111878  ORF Transcript_62984/g.111878 Transcript_62984/m.111878 type:complete len:1385 (-) Transcript_62984:197-4351(-)